MRRNTKASLVAKVQTSASGVWRDVCLKNIVIFLGALAGMGHDDRIIWNALQQIVGETMNWTNKKLAQTWVQLQDYQVIENAVVAALGHPFHLIQVGRYAPNFSFGFVKTVEKYILKGFMRYLTSPRVGVRYLAVVTSGFNSNKFFRFVVDKPDHCVVEVEYLIGPQGKSREQESDFRSSLFYMRGLLEAIAPMWPKQGQIGRVKYLTINVRPEALLRKEAPSLRVEYRDGGFFVQGKKYGRIIHLRRDAKTDAFLGDFQETPENGLIPAVLITKDMTSECTKTGNEYPLLRAGEIYRYQTEITTHIGLNWKTNLFFQFMEKLPGTMRPIATGLKLEERVSVAEMTAATERAGRELLQQVVEEAAPTKAVARALVDKNYGAKRLPTLALLLDIVGYTLIGSEWGVEELARNVTDLFEDLEKIVRDRYGFWPYKRMGDALLVIHADWERDSDEPAPYETRSEAAQELVNCAFFLHEVAKKRGLQLRVGIAAGDVVWSDQAAKHRHGVVFEGLGVALNLAARMETYGAKPGETAVATEVAQLALATGLLIGLAPNQSLGPFRPKGQVTEKGGRMIMVWLAERQITAFDRENSSGSVSNPEESDPNVLLGVLGRSDDNPED